MSPPRFELGTPASLRFSPDEYNSSELLSYKSGALPG